MGRTELPWLLLGRLVRPYPFAASLSSATLAALIFTGESRVGSDDAWSNVVGWLAVLATILLWVGWWGKSSSLMQHGLLLVASVFAAREVYIWLISGSFLTGMLSFTWTVAAAGAFLLEATTSEERAMLLRRGVQVE